MCGRFCLSADIAVIREHFALQHDLLLKPRYNIAPGQVMPVICAPGKLDFLSWGLRPVWLKADQKPFINARIETVQQKPAFKQAYAKRRCLVIANGYYEWKQIGNKKQPYYISLASQELFAFAAIWEGDGCAIFTHAAPAELRSIHERAPVIISKSEYSLWLDLTTSKQQLDALQAKTFDFRVCPVSTQVNSPQHDSAECIKALQ